MGKIRWLHISDLHYDREMMGDWPAGQNGFPVTGIDFIAFTGDMHTYGRDYNEGKRFLTELAKHYNLNPSEDIFIVPGNHDVDPYRVSTKGISAVKLERGRRAAERNAKKATQVVSKSFDDFAIDRLKHLRNAPSDVLNADGSHLSHRFSEYCEAVESICGPAPFSRDRDPFAYAGAFCRKWKNRINLIHVNSALLSCSDTYRAQILDICAINDLSYNPAFNRALPILTKVLPYLGYQMALSSHLDPALTPIKSPNFFRRDAYARTYACLSAYLPTIDIWNEYKNQNPETLEKPWNTLRKLYQDSNPDISDLTAAIPYTVFPSGLLCHHGRNISFCHDNYRDFFAAFHIANVVYGLYSGIDLAALSPDAQEVFLLQLETLDNSILFDAISILRQYFGLSIYDISAQDTTDLSDTCAQIALPAILIRLLDAVIRRGELSKNEHSQLCQLRSTLCERFVLSFKALDESDPLQTKYCLFFSLALSMLARDYRTGVAGTRDLIKCAGYAQQCINGEKKLNIPKADGYLQVALCLNARMEDMLNVTDTKMNGTLPFSSQLADAVREAVRDYHEGSMYKRDEAVRTFRRNLFPRWKPGLGNVLACCDIFQIILEAAYEKYVSAANQNNQNYQEIARLGYVSKAYLVLAAIGTSGGALNLLAQMLINQANQYEADQRISFFRRHPDIDTFVQQHAAPYGWPLNDNYALAYRVLQSVCGIQRGSQPYSHMKKAELVLKGYVSESSSTQLTSLNIAINGGLAMGHYWKGRLLLEQAKQDHDRCNDYKDAAIASFCATNVTERFDHLPENADEDAAPQLSPPQWLSAIELLRYPDRAVFRVDRRMVFQTIYQKLTQQVEEVQSDNIQIHNERYRLTKKDVRSNLERCLDMVKAQFPDKEPLIQKMIRSIR